MITKEKIIKNTIVKLPSLDNTGKLFKHDDSTFINIHELGNANEIIRALERYIVKEDPHRDNVNLALLPLPVMFAVPSLNIDIMNEIEENAIDITIDEANKVMLLVQDYDENHVSCEYYLNKKGNKYILLGYFKVPKALKDGDIKSLWPTLKPNAKDQRTENLDILLSIEVNTWLSAYAICAPIKLPPLSDLKMRNIPGNQRSSHQPYGLSHILSKDIDFVDDNTCMAYAKPETLLPRIIEATSTEHAGLFEDTVPFIFTHSEQKVIYTPSLFKYLPFDKFTVLTSVYQGGATYTMGVTHHEGWLYFSLFNEVVNKVISRTHIKYVLPDVTSQTGIRITKLERLDCTAKRTDAELLHDLPAAIKPMISMLIMYNNLQPEYHVNPNPRTRSEFIRETIVELKRVNVIKLNKPRSLSYQGKVGTHASPEEHQRRGHWRSYKSGKRTFVKETTVNKGFGKGAKKVYIMG